MAKLASFDADDPNDNAIWLTWGNESVPAYPGMWLRRGDVISTGHQAKVVLTFLEEDADVLLMNDTRVEVGSLFTWFGSLFVSGRLNTDTKYASGSVQGTKYHVSVDKETSRATFSVIEGKVTVTPVVTNVVAGHTVATPASGSWAPVVLLPRQQAAVSKGQSAAPQAAPVPEADIQTWIANVHGAHDVGLELEHALETSPVVPSAEPTKTKVTSYVYVPDLTGTSWALARRSVALAGLQLDATSAARADSPTLRVVSQNPLPRVVVPSGTPICLVAEDLAAPVDKGPSLTPSCANFVAPEEK